MTKTLFTTLMGIMAVTGFFACSSSDDDVNDINHDLVAVPNYQSDTWVTDGDIKSEDLDLLVDLGVKIEYMRLELYKMLSNNFEDDKLFCGVGPKTNIDPIINCFTDMMVREEEYTEALDKLDKTNILKPTSGTRGPIQKFKDIFFSGSAEAKEELEKVQDILLQIGAFGDEKSQQQLYDFYKKQEPSRAKEIGAKDAKDFFNKLNKGELNAYILNISHIWRDKGIQESDQTNSVVGDYAYVAFTGHAEYLNSAYRVGSKVAVAAGELYFSFIDNMAGGYGGKIIELGDAIKDKLDMIKRLKKVAEGKPDFQDWNTWVVNNLASDLKEALSKALGDDKNIGTELIEMVAGEIVDHIAKMCTAESAEEVKGDETTVAKKRDEIGKKEKEAVLDIVTDFNSKAKLVMIIDDATGKVTVAAPNDQGHAVLALDPGGKTITVINSNGERLTKHITVEEGLNSVDMQTKKFSIYTNPFEISIDSKGGDEYATVVTNCKYVQQRITKKDDWWKSKIDISGKYIRLTINADPNTEEKSRSGSLILEAYDDNSADAKPVATYTVKFTQDANTPKPQGTLKVSPTTLSFDANGGTKRIEMETDGYEYYGGFAEDDSESWITCTASANGVNVTVAANTTGNKRTGNVYAFVTNTTNAQSLDDVTYAIVKVTQEANAEEPEQPEVKYELVSGNISMYYAVAWRSDLAFKVGDDGVTITPSGKGAKVQIQQSGKDTGRNAEWKYTLSFDVDDLSLFDSHQAKISNFKYDYDKEGKGRDYYGSHVDWEKETTLMTSNAPMQQTATGGWYFYAKDLSYHSKSTIHYDKWKKDIYSDYTEHTDESETSEVTDGSSVSIGLTIKKK